MKRLILKQEDNQTTLIFKGDAQSMADTISQTLRNQGQLVIETSKIIQIVPYEVLSKSIIMIDSAEE